VLEQGVWPIKPKGTSVNIPPAIDSLQNTFADFYKTRRKGKRISFIPHMATAQVQARFDLSKPDTKQIEMSGLQAAVILQFNQNDQLTYSQLLALTGLAEEDLNIQLISLACFEHKLLLTDDPDVRW
jgi:hypothetical protein